MREGKEAIGAQIADRRGATFMSRARWPCRSKQTPRHSAVAFRRAPAISCDGSQILRWILHLREARHQGFIPREIL